MVFPIADQNGESLYPFSDQKGAKTPNDPKLDSKQDTANDPQGLKLLDHRVLKQINAKTDKQKYKQTKKP